MDGIGSVWPPDLPLRTDRLVLRAPISRDRSAIVELHSSSDVYRFLGGARARGEVEATVPVTPGPRLGVLAVELHGEMIGTVSLSERGPDRPGRELVLDGRVELSYLFLPDAWGHGYAAESCAAVLDWTDGALPREPVVLCTQSANERSVRLATRLGFSEAGRFEEFGAEQWYGVRRPC